MYALILSAAFGFNVNNAPADSLAAIKGIGPVYASRMIAARDSAAFRTCDDIAQRVKGIGPKRAAALCPRISF